MGLLRDAIRFGNGCCFLLRCANIHQLDGWHAICVASVLKPFGDWTERAYPSLRIALYAEPVAFGADLSLIPFEN